MIITEDNTRNRTEPKQTIQIDSRVFQRFFQNMVNAANKSGLKGEEYYKYLLCYVKEVEKMREVEK